MSEARGGGVIAAMRAGQLQELNGKALTGARVTGAAPRGRVLRSALPAQLACDPLAQVGVLRRDEFEQQALHCPARIL